MLFHAHIDSHRSGGDPSLPAGRPHVPLPADHRAREAEEEGGWEEAAHRRSGTRLRDDERVRSRIAEQKKTAYCGGS